MTKAVEPIQPAPTPRHFLSRRLLQNRQRMLLIISTIVAMCFLLRLLPVATAAEPKPLPTKNPDVTVSWDKRWYMEGDDKPTVKFFVDQQVVGENEAGLKAVIETVRRLPRGASVVWWRDVRKIGDREPGSQTVPPAVFPKLWQEFQQVAKERGVTLSSLGYRPRIDDEPRKKPSPKVVNYPAHCRFEWRNFQSAATPHDEVVYLFDGKPVGMGDTGFDVVLNLLKALPRGAYVEYPQFGIHGKAYNATKREEFKSKDMVPFDRRRDELNTVLANGKFNLGRYHVLYWPKPTYGDYVDGGIERSWYLPTLLRFATIIRDDAKPAQADAVISWTQKKQKRKEPPDKAIYFYNGENTGIGTQGFLAVLKRLESLSDGATVRIDPVSIRTHGPFRFAIVMRGQRHFETTGSDPFRGLVDLLAEVAQRKGLRVELIPAKETPADMQPDDSE